MADATASGLHIYYGPDSFRLREAYRELREALDGDGLLATNTTQLAGRGLSPAELIQHATTLPFLAQARVVVVDGLISSLGGGQAVVRQWEPLLELLPELPPSNHLVLLEPLTRERSRSFGRSALLGALRAIEGADVRDFPELRSYAGRNESESPVAAWARERAAAAGIAIEPAALAELVELVGSNLWVIASEIEKLGQYAGARPVTRVDVRLLTPEASEAGIFDLVDSVVEGRSASALLLIRKMLEQGTDTPSRIQNMIARQVRHLVRATELLEQGADRSAVMEATGVRSDFPLNKLLRQARSTSRAAAEQALREIERSDHAVKTGQTDDVLALELLVMRLGALVRRPAAAR
ncbi:MAG: DNA polymerase III subunit delta [Dehalococcoidia bacterium]